MRRVEAVTVRTSVTQRVQDWLLAHPAVAESLDLGVVNLSALARRIQDDLHIERQESVVTALRRARTQRGRLRADESVRRALDDSRVEMRSHVGLLAYEASWRLLSRLSEGLSALGSDEERIHIFHGWEDITVVADEDLIEDLQRVLGREEPLDRRTGLVELNLRCDNADVPGFLAATSAALAARGINLIDAVSCRQDHIFLIEESSLPQAVAALDRLRHPK